jgi:hypothetical protein
MSEEIWVTVDEATDVVGSIRHSLRCRKVAHADPLAWKWYIISLHSALQGAIVCHLTTTAAPIGALTDDSHKAWIEKINSRDFQKNPKIKILELPSLVKKIRKSNAVCGGGQLCQIHVSDKDYQKIEKFHKVLRNQFTHFSPKIWSIEIDFILDHQKPIFPILRSILQWGCAFRHLEHQLRDEMEHLIGQLESY